MSEGDVNAFRRFHAAWTDGDLETVLALVDPEVVVRPLHGAMFTRGEFRGREGIADWFHEMHDPYDRFETIVEAARETDGGVMGLVCLVGHRGEERLHARVGVVCEMRDGRILRLTARNASDVEARMRDD